MSKRYLSLLGVLLFGLASGCSPEGATAADRRQSLGKPPKTRTIPDLPGWVTVPGGTAVLGSHEEGAPVPREVRVDSFWMTRTEITVAQFARFLNDTGTDFVSPQMLGSAGHRAPLAAREPVAYVAYTQAMAYAAWLGAKLNVEASIPQPDEWEYAARGGIHGAPFPWGWADAVGRAAFRLDHWRPVGAYPPNPYKLYDMAGNLAEWCRAGAPASLHAPVRGGSWPERTDRMLRVWKSATLPVEYRDADVGFRVIARPLGVRNASAAGMLDPDRGAIQFPPGVQEREDRADKQ